MTTKILRVFLVIGICIFVYACHDNNARSQVQVQNPFQQIQNPTQIDKTPTTKCLDGQELKTDGTCAPVCETGKTRNSSGDCVTSAVTCTDGKVLQTDNTCACPADQELKADGTCGAVAVTCTGGQVLQTDNTCACPADQELKSNGTCGPIASGPASTGEWGSPCQSDNTCNIGMKCDAATSKCVGKKEWVLMEGNIGFPDNFSYSLETGNTTYLGTYGGGVFRRIRTLSAGHSTANNYWTQINAGLKNFNVYSLILGYTSNSDVGIVYAGTGAGVFKLSNDGNNWIEVNNGLVGSLNRIPEIISLLSVDNDIYAGTIYDGVFKLSDGSSNWVKVNTGIPADIVWASLVADADNNIYMGSRNKGAFINPVPSHAGDPEAWNSINDGLVDSNGQINIAIKKLLSAGNEIYAATFDKGVFMFTKSSNRWIPVNGGLPNSNGQLPHIHNSLLANNTLYAQTSSEVYKLNKGQGASPEHYAWSTVNTGLPANSYIDGTLLIGNDVFAKIGNYIYKLTSNGGGRWARTGMLPLNSLAKRTECITFADGKLYAVVRTKDYNSTTHLSSFYVTVLKWDENNKKWLAVSGKLEIEEEDIISITIVDNNIYAATSEGFFKSAIGSDSTWSSNMGAAGLRARFDLLSNGGDIYAGASTGVFKFTTGANSWSQVGTGSIGSVYSLFLNGSDLYAGTYTGVYKFTIGGSTDWSRIGPAIQGGITGLILKDNDIYIRISLKAFKSSNDGSGSSWLQVGSRFGSSSVETDKLFLVDNNIYTLNNGIISKFTIGNSADWEAAGPADINTYSTYSIFSSGHAIYAGMEYGVWIYVE